MIFWKGVEYIGWACRLAILGALFALPVINFFQYVEDVAVCSANTVTLECRTWP